MKQFVTVLALMASLTGCNGHGPPASAYEHISDQLKVATGLSAFFSPCWRGESVLATDQCYRMQAARRWQGLWRNDFEGFEFCPAPASACAYDPRGGMIRLLPDDVPAKYKRLPGGGLYRLDFIGRRTANGGGVSMTGNFKEMMVVDRMISVEQIEAPPKREK